MNFDTLEEALVNAHNRSQETGIPIYVRVLRSGQGTHSYSTAYSRERGWSKEIWRTLCKITPVID